MEYAKTCIEPMWSVPVFILGIILGWIVKTVDFYIHMDSKEKGHE